MPISANDGKHINLSMDQPERLCPVAKALSSPMRVRMLGLLASRSMNVNEMAEALNLPISTAALNVRQLEESGLITSEIQPGVRGAMKLCSQRVESVSLRLTPDEAPDAGEFTVQLPIGGYSVAEDIRPNCGAVSERARIGENNLPQAFYHQDRFGAQLLWFASGALEYRFSLGDVDPDQVQWLEFSMEMSSGAARHSEDERSDIFVSVNDRPLGVWTSPGDHAGRRGRLNPPWWDDASSQFGLLKTWRVDADGSHLDGKPISGVTLDDLDLARGDYISLRLGVDKDAEHVGGLNLFGEKFGDHAQGVVMRVGTGKS